ncbi:DUF6479 family protein [Streptomyces pactum]|uniref:DUF6479 family protein n=1 Tax=Streptomyces pactum TaxID=68249 RepID=UPI0037003F53
MSTFASVEFAARDHLVGIGPLVAGIGVVIVLVAAVWWGIRVAARERRPTEPQPRAGAWQTAEEHRSGHVTSEDHGPGHQESERHYERYGRKPTEVPRDGVRHMPYEFGNFGSEEDPEKKPTKWTPGHSGSWGTG